jgi:hypothetical protein
MMHGVLKHRVAGLIALASIATCGAALARDVAPFVALAREGVPLVALARDVVPLVALTRDGGQWQGTPESVREWFRKLMQPDNPAVSCCGEADAYEADNFDVEGDHYIAVITNGHGVIPNGSRIADHGPEHEDEMGQRQSDRTRNCVHRLGWPDLLLRDARQRLKAL